MPKSMQEQVECLLQIASWNEKSLIKLSMQEQAKIKWFLQEPAKLRKPLRKIYVGANWKERA